jgi:parallel beta-helix repeat protein
MKGVKKRMGDRMRRSNEQSEKFVIVIVVMIIGVFFVASFAKAAENICYMADVTGTGNIYYVAKTGSDSSSCSQAQSQSTSKLTITGALGCLQPGDTLYIREGTYDESFSYTASVPSGTSWSAPVTLSAFPGETVTIRPTTGPCGGAPCRVFEFFDSDQYIVINGFILDAINSPFEVVKFSGGHQIRLSNNELKNGKGSGIYGGINNQYIKNDVHDNGTNDFDHGMYIFDPGNLIQGNTVHHNTGWGIHIYSEDHTDVSNNVVCGNYVYSNGTSGTRGPGILLGSGSNNIAYNNIVQGNIGGIQIGFGAANASVYNNTIYANRDGCIGVDPESTTTVLKNNICYLNDSGGITDLGRGTIQSNNLMSNPSFLNPAASDFHLQSGSAAIEKGANLFSVGVTTDFDGVARPQVGNYDIGAYEYH